MWHGERRRRHAGWSGFAICLALLVVVRPADAQPQGDVAVLREARGTVEAGAAERIDAALVHALAQVGGIHPSFSQVSYGEVQLMVGCVDESPLCLTEIALVAEADALVVRELTVDPSGTATLRLVYFEEAGGRPPREVRQSTARDRLFELESAMPALVRQLLDVPETAGARSPATTAELARGSSSPGPAGDGGESGGATRDAIGPQPGGDGVVSAPAWIALVGGAALLGAGVGLWLWAGADHDALEDTRVRTVEDADRVHRELDSIETRTTLGNVFVPAGAVALGIGALLLALDLSAGDEAQTGAMRFTAGALPGGAAFAVRGALGEVR